MAGLLSLDASLIGRIVGKHLLDNHKAGAGAGRSSRSSAAGSTGRSSVPAPAFYGLDPGVRAGVDSAIAAAVLALKTATIG